MAYLSLRRAVPEPTGAVSVNFEHPLCPTRGFVFRHPRLCLGYGSEVTDLTLNPDGGTATSWSTAGLSTSTLTLNYKAAGTGISIDGATKFSIAMLVTGTSATTTRSSPWAVVGTGAMWSMGTQFTNRLGVFGYTYNNGGSATYWHSASNLWTEGRPTLWTYVYDGSLATANDRPKLWLDGESVSLSHAGGSHPASVTNDGTLAIGGQRSASPGTIFGWRAEVHSFWFWRDRALTAAEVRTHAARPYEMLDDAPRTYFIPAAAAPAGTGYPIIHRYYTDLLQGGTP